jgi:hypothetical protein
VFHFVDLFSWSLDLASKPRISPANHIHYVYKRFISQLTFLSTVLRSTSDCRLDKSCWAKSLGLIPPESPCEKVEVGNGDILVALKALVEAPVSLFGIRDTSGSEKDDNIKYDFCRRLHNPEFCKELTDIHLRTKVGARDTTSKWVPYIIDPACRAWFDWWFFDYKC